MARNTQEGATQTTESTAAAQLAGAAPYRMMVVLGVVILLTGMGEGAARTFFNVYLDAGLHTPTASIGVLAAVGQLLAAPAALAMPLAAHAGVTAVSFSGARSAWP